jgi:fumarate reductase flavoprotein subunit
MGQIISETDLVVIGSGAAGLVAALTAAEAGAKVVVFEKETSFGGTSNFFEGTFAVESEEQRKRYITYSKDEAFKNIVEFSHWRANGRLIRAIIDESAETIAWLQKQGVEFSDVIPFMSYAPHTYHVVKGKGEALIKTLVSRAKAMGVELLSGIAVKKIIKTGDKVSGVVYTRDDNDAQIKAKAVFIASGGFANNKEMLKKYTGFDLNENLIPVGNVDKMGDGIRMAFEIGAAEEGISVLELNRVGPVGPEFGMANQIEFAGGQPDLWVDIYGRRFCDEGICFVDSSIGNANSRYKEGYTFTMFDDSIKQYLVEHGIEKNVTILNGPGAKPVNIDREIKKAVERGTTEVFMGDSVEELAKNMGVPPDVLKETVDEYNSFCRKGHDDTFAKNPKYLRELKGPKFYAIKARTIFLGTIGGIKINEKIEVIDKKMKPIPGLYAGGYDAGGMWGDSYCMKYSPGLSSAFATNSGRIAGKNIAAYLGTK